MAEDNTFQINITSFDGYSPAYYSNSWSAFGNKGSANSMVDIDISDPNVLTQGPGKIALTNGTQTGIVSTLITSIMKGAVSTDATYGVGLNKVYKISSTAVANSGGFPATIDKSTVTDENATDIVYYKSYLYALYNHSGGVGDIAKITPSNGTIDADWGSTIPTGAGTLNYAPHWAIVGGNDMMCFTNGSYIGKLDGDTLNLIGLDFPTDSEADTITWNGDYFLIGVNRPVVSGANYNQSAIYTWDGYATSWNIAPTPVNGKIGALYTFNGVTYVWWQDNNGTGGCNFGYLDGSTLKHIKRYSGSLPNQGQVCDQNGFILWLSGNNIFVWGAGDDETSVKFFNYMTSTYSTGGSISSPFGSLLVSSNATTSYIIEKENGYSTSSNWKTIVYNLLSPNNYAVINNIRIVTEQLDSGAKLDINLIYNQGSKTKSLRQIAYSSENTTNHLVLQNIVVINDFRLEFSWANGSSTNPVKIRGIYISGEYTPIIGNK